MNWFEEAMEFDIHLGSYNEKVKEVTNHLFNDICKRIIIRNKPRSKETLKLVLLNLWVALQQGVPVYYSRNANNYSRSRRYGMLHVKYNRLIPIVDTLETMGLIRQKGGWSDREKGFARQTRMYAMESLIKLFTHIRPATEEVIQKLPPRETVQLKDASKKLIDYRETEHTVAMRRNLFHYNNFIKKQDIKLDLPGDCVVDRRFLKELYQNILKGVVSIDNVDIVYPNILNRISNDNVYSSNSNILTYQSLPYYTPPYNIFYLMYDTHTTHYHTLLYYLSTMTNKIRDMENRNEVKAFLSETKSLAEFGINRLGCRMNYEVLHRVFNNGSFNLGGRFFGACHVGLGKKFRRHITVNGEPTVELDYSALHIRMLYHIGRHRLSGRSLRRTLRQRCRPQYV